MMKMRFYISIDILSLLFLVAFFFFSRSILIFAAWPLSSFYNGPENRPVGPMLLSYAVKLLVWFVNLLTTYNGIAWKQFIIIIIE